MYPGLPFPPSSKKDMRTMNHLNPNHATPYPTLGFRLPCVCSIDTLTLCENDMYDGNRPRTEQQLAHKGSCDALTPSVAGFPTLSARPDAPPLPPPRTSLQMQKEKLKKQLPNRV